jgi:hypothetical protein
MGSQMGSQKFYRSVISENTINSYTDRKFIFSCLQHISYGPRVKELAAGRITEVWKLQGRKFVTSLPCPDRLWSPPGQSSHPVNWHGDKEAVAWNWPFHMVPRLWMHAAIFSLLQTPSWCGIKYKGRVRVTLQLTVNRFVLVSSPRYLIFIVKVTVLSIWGALSDERSGLSLIQRQIYLHLYILLVNATGRQTQWKLKETSRESLNLIRLLKERLIKDSLQRWTTSRHKYGDEMQWLQYKDLWFLRLRTEAQALRLSPNSPV